MTTMKGSNTIDQQTFLQFAVKQALSNHSLEEMYKQTFIFPSRRAGLFFLHELSKEYNGKPFISPRIMTTDEFIGSMTTIGQADAITLLFELYDIYCKHIGENAKEFDDFVYWGDMMLRDFNDIDRYMADASQVFGNIKDLKELTEDFNNYLNDEQKAAIHSFLNVFIEQDSETEKQQQAKENFLDFFAKLNLIYKDFTSTLKNQHCGSQGMIYRDVANQLLSKDIHKDGQTWESTVHSLDHLYVIGLFGLSQSEYIIFEQLKKRLDEKIHFLWDASGELANDINHKVYKILKKNRERLGGDFFVAVEDEDFRNKISIKQIASNIGQTRLVPDILKKEIYSIFTNKEGKIDNDAKLNTLLMPADESLLFPLISSLDDQIFHPLNITMGYPLAQSAIASLMEMWFAMQAQIQKRIDSNNNYWIGADTLVNALSHPIIVHHPDLTSTKDTKGHNFVQTILNNKRYYIYKDELPLDKGLTKLLFSPAFINEDGKLDNMQIFHHAEKLLQLIILYLLNQDKEKTNTTEDDNKDKPISLIKLNAEFASMYYKIIVRIHDMCKNYRIDNISIQTLTNLIIEQVGLTTFSFRGEPLEGLQLMGKLETRCLSFKYQIILSASEGILPQASQVTTLIPHNVRFGFGLPTIENTQITEAYHFFRLISTAKKVFMIYDSRTSMDNAGEESRYIKQLKYVYGYNIKEEKINLLGNIQKSQVEREKSLESQRKLSQYIKENDKNEVKQNKALAPTTINEYVTCPLKFYFNKVKGINISNDPEEMINGGDFGSILHDSMQSIYDQLTHNKQGSISNPIPISPDLIEIYLKQPELIRKVVISNYKILFGIENKDISSYAELTIDLIVQYVTNILKYDLYLAKNHNLRYIASEQTVNTDIEIELKNDWLEHKQGDIIHIKVKGTIDRIDMIYVDGSDKLRIVDYKTENLQESDLKFFKDHIYKLNDTPGWNFGKQYNKVLDQVMMYCEIKRSNDQIQIPIQPTIYAVRLMSGLTKDEGNKDIANALDMQREDSRESCLYDNKVAEKYVSRLKEQLQNLFDSEKSFEQAKEGSAACTYCDFKSVCGR